MTITGFCSRLSWEHSPCKAWWRRVKTAYEQVHVWSARRNWSALWFIGQGEATVIDGLWRRTAFASRLFGEPAVQAPAPLLHNWSPQNLSTHKLPHHVRILLSEAGESACTHRSASISSLYRCSFLLVFFLLPNSSSPTDRHRPRLSLSKPYKAR